MSRISAPRGSFGYAQDRSFDSAPSAVPRDKSVRRFAQDDDFVGGLKKNTPNRLTLVDASPGLALKGRFVPQGRLRIGRYAILDYLQPSCGAKFVNPGSHTHSLAPAPFISLSVRLRTAFGSSTCHDDITFATFKVKVY